MKKKKFLSLFTLNIVIITQLLCYPVLAADKNDSNIRKNIIITNEAIIQGDSNKTNISESIATVTESNFIPGWFGFTFYTDGSFTQGSTGMSCVPVAASNILANYEYRGKVNLFGGSTMTQSEFNQLCTDSLWTSSGTSLENGAKGVVTYAKRKGYTASYSMPLLKTWDTIKSYINGGYPVMISDGRHSYLAVGYKVENGIQALYTYQGYASQPFTWLNWSYVQGMAKIVIN